MTTTAKIPDLSKFCSVCARQSGLDPVGFAYSYEHVVVLELPLPWPETMYDQPGVLPQELLEFRRLIVEAYKRGESFSSSSLVMAPDPVYSQEGMRRVISYKRPNPPFATFEQVEYLVPEGQEGPLAWALLVDNSALPQFAEYLVPERPVRDIMVCTHGAIDAACAKFGFPTYRHLRGLADHAEQETRVWRVSHFGGHEFAPTLLDMPEFRFWAYMDPTVCDSLLFHQGETVMMRDRYRGWAGLGKPVLQVAERELFVKFGWEWLQFAKSGRIIEQCSEDKPTWYDVQISYSSPDRERQGCYQMHVEYIGVVDCSYSTKTGASYAHDQYRVTAIERIS